MGANACKGRKSNLMTCKKAGLVLLIGLWAALVSCGGLRHTMVGQQDSGSSILWKISGKNLAAPSYLFGTIHLICPDKFFWTAAMQQAFDGCKQLAEEVDVRNTSALAAMKAGMLLPEGEKLQDYFTPAEFDDVVAYTKDSLGLRSIAMVLPLLKPSMALAMLSVNTGVQCEQSAVSYDLKIAEWATAAGKKIVGLETAEDQLKALNNISSDSAVKRILQLVREPGKAANEYKKLVKAYLHQNLDALNAFLNLSDPPTMLFERNKKWIGRIEKLIQQQPTFIAVGAGHLGGEKGVIHLLKKAGYTLHPVH